MLINDYFPSFQSRNDYQNDNFLHFLKKVGFSYSIPTIHIAGTNGKGSTATYIARILKEAGYKVGLYTSPYFYDLNEMIEINGEYIKDEEIKKYLDSNRKLIEKNDLSEFEIMTFIAYKFFQDHKCDIAVIECGMGGEIDATNIIDEPLLSIITTVSMEHTSFLGKSISEIAINKAGIIKDGCPTLIGDLVEDAEKAIAEIANSLDSKLYKVGTVFDVKVDDKGMLFSYHHYHDVLLSSYADYATKDAALAIEAINIISSKFLVKEEAIREGLKNAHMNNRMEELSSSPTFVIDGAHNVEAVETLVKSIYKKYHYRHFHVIFSCFQDKNLALMLPHISLLGKDVTLTTFDHPRSRKQEDYFLFLEDYSYEDDHISLIKNKLKEYPEDVILVTGSLAFAALVRKEFLEGKFNND